MKETQKMDILLDDIKEIKTDIRKLREDVSEISKEVSINGRALDEHVRRTEASEARLEVVEHNMLSFQAAVKTAIKLATVIGSTFLFIQQLLPLIQKLLH